MSLIDTVRNNTRRVEQEQRKKLDGVIANAYTLAVERILDYSSKTTSVSFIIQASELITAQMKQSVPIDIEQENQVLTSVAKSLCAEGFRAFAGSRNIAVAWELHERKGGKKPSSTKVKQLHDSQGEELWTPEHEQH